MHVLKITPVLNGWVVQCGCQTVVFTSLLVMTGEIQRYFQNPVEVEAEYLKKALNKPDNVVEDLRQCLAEQPMRVDAIVRNEGSPGTR